MSDPVWYRSLYFRIAFGFVALLATLLVLQGSAFLWMSGQMPELFFSRSPTQLAESLATDVASLLGDSAVTDLPGEITRNYANSGRGFAIALEDGRVIESKRVLPPPDLRFAATSRLAAIRFGPLGDPGRFRNFGRDDRPRGPGRRGDDADGAAGGPSPNPGPGGTGFGSNFGRGGSPPDLANGGPFPPPNGGRESFGRGFGSRGGRGGRGGAEYANVMIDGRVVGVVAVPLQAPPWWFSIQQLGPALGFVALALLVVGTAVGALVIVGPTRRRLQELQHAAQALGEGQPGARAPETGGDEVTALSHTFNAMASQLESRSQALEQADRTRRQLLADVSHELMTPLSAIRGYVETLGMAELSLDAATRNRYLGIVNEEAGRLENIIGDLLDLARLEGGGGTFRVHEVSLAQLLARVRDRHGPSVNERQVTLTTYLDPSLESLQGDANRLEQALQNLVANAVRHTPEGGTVAVAATPRDGHVVLSVEDTGPGIPAEHLSRVFDRFYKVDESRSGTDVPSGSGLGLSIVQAIVARHHGTVSASNVPGSGARFEMIVPRGDPPPEDDVL
jgi:signal transduction histidine kinase